ncbi:MAG: OmpH family outer membrane protein [Verrucomicrobiaceae bacterium]|nr:OmpH family outer membrane protein [Verrucomicrobiaceae bacterium]
MNRSALSALLILATTALSSAADLKIAVIDMKKAFEDFHKTQEAAETYKGNYNKAAGEMRERQDTYKKLTTDMQALDKRARDTIITPEQRQKAIAELNEKMKEARALEMEMQEFAERRIGQLKQEDMKIRQTLYEEISKAVTDHALSSGFDLVFDKTGVSLSTVPVLIYAKNGPTTDITAEIIVKLNKDAPPPGAAPKKEEAAAPAPAAAPADAKK